MAWSFNGDRPIYAQLVENLQERIVRGEYPPGARMAAVRELAAEAEVNPNTMQRALAELENRGLVYSRRTAGRFVTEDTGRIAALREELARQLIARFIRETERLGLARQEVLALLEQTVPDSHRKTTQAQETQGGKSPHE